MIGDSDRELFDRDVVSNIYAVKKIIAKDSSIDGQLEKALNQLLDLLLPPRHNNNSFSETNSKALSADVSKMMEKISNEPSLANECLAFVRQVSSEHRRPRAMDNRADLLAIVEHPDEGSPVVSEECKALISQLYSVILPPPDPDLEVNNTLIMNLTSAIQFLDEVDDGLAITNDCKEAIRELLSLVSPPSAIHIKDTCSVCRSDEYGTYHRTGFKCLRCFGVRETQEEATGYAASKAEVSHLALNRHLISKPPEEAVKYQTVVKSLESIDTPIFVDSVTRAQQVLQCSDPKKYDPQGFEYSDIEHEAAAALGLLEGRFTKRMDLESKGVSIAINATLCPHPSTGVGMLRELPSPGKLPGKYLATRTEGFHFLLTESFRTRIRSLAHPNLLYLFSLAVSTKPSATDGNEVENDCVWYIHENLPLLVEHLAEDENYLEIEGGGDSPLISLRLRASSTYTLGENSQNGQQQFSGASMLNVHSGDGDAATNMNVVTSESIEEIKAVMFSIFSAANALHEQGIVHGDFRPHNLFRDPVTPIVKVRFAPNYKRLPEPFCPPECQTVTEDEEFIPTIKGDIYTIGITLRLLVFGTSSDTLDDLASLSQAELHVWRFISELTASNPEERPTAASLVDGHFLSVVRIAQGVPVACRISTITVEKEETEKEKQLSSQMVGASARLVPRKKNKALNKLSEFIAKKGPDFQVIRKGDSVTLYSTKNDPRQQDIAKQRQQRKSSICPPE